MKTAFVFRGQGIGVQTDKVFLERPSQEDFDEVMTRELVMHGFDPKTGEPRERWVMLMEVVVDDAKASKPCPIGPGDKGRATLSQEQADALRAAPPEAQGGAIAAPPMSMSGEGTVANPSDK